MTEEPDWLLIAAKEMMHGIRLMQDRGLLPPQYGTSIPDTIGALIRRIDPSFVERPR